MLIASHVVAPWVACIYADVIFEHAILKAGILKLAVWPYLKALLTVPYYVSSERHIHPTACYVISLHCDRDVECVWKSAILNKHVGGIGPTFKAVSVAHARSEMGCQLRAAKLVKFAISNRGFIYRTADSVWARADKNDVLDQNIIGKWHTNYVARKFYILGEQGSIIARPSGTEPKVKFYYTTVGKTKEEAILSSIAIFRPNPEYVLPEFLCYILKSPKVYNYISQNCVSGSALPRIVLKAFKEVEVSLPSIAIQKWIISKLIPIDQKIQLNRQINDNLTFKQNKLAA